MSNSQLPPIPKQSMSTPAASHAAPVLPTPSTSTRLASRSGNASLRQQLENQLAENERLLQASNNGIGKNVLAGQISQLKDRLRDMDQSARQLRRQPSGADDTPPVTMDMLRSLERDLNSHRSSAWSSRLQRGTGIDPLPSPSTSGLLASREASSLLSLPPPATGSTPTKRRSKIPNADRRNTDIEFATEIGQGLLLEVRKMQAILQEKEKQVSDLEIQKADLERAAESMAKLLRQREESEEQLKEDTWNLELAKQELTIQVTELQANLNKANAEHSKMTRQLNTLRSEMEHMRDREEKLNATVEAMKQRHEQDMSSLRRHAAGMQRDKAELTKQMQRLTSELAIAKSQTRIGKAGQSDLHGLELSLSDHPSHEASGTEKDAVSPKPSPPPSPKQSPLGNHALEVETLKTSLAHAHRMVSNLRSNLHREKTEKFELKKLLTESQETIEQLQNHPKMWQDARQVRIGEGSTSATRRNRKSNAKRRGKRRALGTRSHKTEGMEETVEEHWDTSDLEEQMASSSDDNEDDHAMHASDATQTAESKIEATASNGFASLSSELSRSSLPPQNGRDGWSRSLGDELTVAFTTPVMTAPDTKPAVDTAIQTDMELCLSLYPDLERLTAQKLGPLTPDPTPEAALHDNEATCSMLKVSAARGEPCDAQDSHQSQSKATVHNTIQPQEPLGQPQGTTTAHPDPGSASQPPLLNSCAEPNDAHQPHASQNHVATTDHASTTASDPSEQANEMPTLPDALETKVTAQMNTVAAAGTDMATQTNWVTPATDMATQTSLVTEGTDMATQTTMLSPDMPPDAPLDMHVTPQIPPEKGHADRQSSTEAILDKSKGDNVSETPGQLVVVAQTDDSNSSPLRTLDDDCTETKDSTDTVSDAEKDKDVFDDGIGPTYVTSGRPVSELGNVTILSEHAYEGFMRERQVVSSDAAPDHDHTPSVLQTGHRDSSKLHLASSTDIDSSKSSIDTTISNIEAHPTIPALTSTHDRSVTQQHPPSDDHGHEKQRTYTQAEADAMVAAAIAAVKAEYQSREVALGKMEASVPDKPLEQGTDSLPPEAGETPPPRPTVPPPSMLLNKATQRARNMSAPSTTESTGRFGTATINSQPTIYAGKSLDQRRNSDSVSSVSTANTERRPSISSSQMDAAARAVNGVTDPNAIRLITQTMIGDWMWKYTRKTIGNGISERRHKRYFWIHPYTRTLYWSVHAPGVDGESNAKSAFIENITVIPDHTNSPSGLPSVSLLVQTQGRQIKLTAPDLSRHEVWYESLSYLIARAASESKKNVDRQDVTESLSTGRASMFRKSSFQRLHASLSHPANSLAASNAEETSNTTHTDDDEDDDMEDVRMCCNGKHHVSKLEKDHLHQRRRERTHVSS